MGWTATSDIGTLYKTGDGVRMDLSKGMRWFTKAAKAGNVAAMCTLAWCHRYGGDGVSVDLAQAKKWYSKCVPLVYSFLALPHTLLHTHAPC
jgi:TPR repeat protein